MAGYRRCSGTYGSTGAAGIVSKLVPAFNALQVIGKAWL